MPVNFPSNPSIGTPYTYEGILWKWNGYAWYIVGSEMDLIGLTAPGLFFTSNIDSNFTNSKTWGKYVGGDRVAAQGKTAVTVIEEALLETLTPTATVSSTTSVAFNQTAISNVINFSHTIPDGTATISGATLEYKKTTGSTWLFLSGSTSTSSTYGHNFTDSNFNTAGYQYRRSVKDSKNRTGTSSTLTITPASYVQPSISITQTGITLVSPETNTFRESGNVLTNISAGITRNSPNVQLTGWEFLFSRNGGAYQTTGFTAAISGVGGFTSTGITQHSPGNTATSVVYRVRVRDEYQDFLNSYIDGTPASTISFTPLIFFGPMANTPTTSNEIRGLGSRVFQDTSTFNLLTGTAFTKFVVAMPNSYTISSVIDQTAANFNITSSYTSGLQSGFTGVANYAGITLAYNVYVMSVGLAYQDQSHTHIITRV